MDAKIGAFICSGCGIGEALEVEKLAKTAQKAGAVCVHNHACLCGPEGAELIRREIAANQLNRAVIAACSGRYFADVFTFGPAVLVDRVNIREQVSWTHEPNNEDTQALAEDYVRVGMTKVKHSEPPEPLVTEVARTVMVVGGGVTGLTAAKAAADAGYDVELVEKEPELGGWAARFGYSFPRQAPWTELETGGVADLIAGVQAHPRIRVHTSTTVEKTAGAPGDFGVTLKNGREIDLRVGAIVQASGWRPYDATRLGHLGYGASPDVVTNVELEAMLRDGALKRPSTGQAPRSVAFIQCAGSRDPEHLPYCSAVCCRTSLKQALLVRRQHPDAKVYILYKDMRTPAQGELFYQEVQKDAGIFLTKGEIGEVAPAGDALAVRATETLLGAQIELRAEMVVLATGMVPTTKVDVGILHKDDEAGAEAGADAVPATAAPEDAGGGAAAGGAPAAEPAPAGDSLLADGKQAAAGAEVGAHILNLAYRQGTDLPTLKYGFPDSHFICFPYETRRTAIYAAGCVRAPMDTLQARRDAHGAALKAIQAIEMTARGQAVHPRSRDLSNPDFFLQRCTQCKRCTEECPFGTLDEDAKGTPMPNPTRCRRCGICMGACPERIISFKNYSPNMVSQMIKAIEIPDEEDEKFRVLCFVCENDAYPAVDMAGLRRLKYNAMVRFIPVRCLGSVNTVWIGDALASGFDGILLLGCKYGDDYQCHFVRGSELANTRMANVQDKLKQLSLEPERVQIHTLAINEYHKLPAMLDDFLAEVEGVGQNPYKGF